MAPAGRFAGMKLAALTIPPAPIVGLDCAARREVGAVFARSPTRAKVRVCPRVNVVRWASHGRKSLFRPRGTVGFWGRTRSLTFAAPFHALWSFHFLADLGWILQDVSAPLCGAGTQVCQSLPLPLCGLDSIGGYRGRNALDWNASVGGYRRNSCGAESNQYCPSRREGSLVTNRTCSGNCARSLGFAEARYRAIAKSELSLRRNSRPPEIAADAIMRSPRLFFARISGSRPARSTNVSPVSLIM